MNNRFFNLFLIAIALLCGTPMMPMGICYASPVDMPIPQNIASAIRQAQARYDSGNVSGAAELLTRILERYPDNKEAKALLEKCKETERDDYNNAVSSMSVSSLEAFIKKYPGSSYSDRAHQLIEDLPLWLEASKENTVESYNRYLSNSTQQIYKEEAAIAIADLTAEAAYQKAVEKNTVSAFQQYLNDYPDSKRFNDASNKIARLLADKFNSKSTYSDKSNALIYAKNEMTRDYVNNKFNRATSASTSRTSTTTGTNSRANNSTTSTSSAGTNRGVYNNTSYSQRESKFSFGLQGFFDFANVSSLEPTYLGGIGLEIRIGSVEDSFNLLLGAKFGWASYEYSYYEKQYYGSKTWEYDLVDIDGSGKSTNLLIPVILNWNFVKSDWACWYLGLGYQYGIPTDTRSVYGQQSHALIVQNGLGFRHFDMRMYYSWYQTSMFRDSTPDSPKFGISMTYYF